MSGVWYSSLFTMSIHLTMNSDEQAKGFFSNQALIFNLAVAQEK